MNNYLDHLENETIFILREAFANAKNPVILFSSGKDSCTLLHIARKAFKPHPIPFQFLNVDTGWKFKEMYEFRDYLQKKNQLNLKIYLNQEAKDQNINPFDHGSNKHTELYKTVGLKKALDLYQYDIIIGGARRDEEKSRSKERVFSFRNANHQWLPEEQRPEPWRLYNTSLNKNETLRVFPLSNWTEVDIWKYIEKEQIEVPSLYFAKERKVIERDGLIILLNDERIKLNQTETPQLRMVRFRTLGCYPLTGAVDSKAKNVSEIISELESTNTSERIGRAIDRDAVGSMEIKKRSGYF